MDYSIRTFRGYGTQSRICISGQLVAGRAATPRKEQRTATRRTRLWQRVRHALRLAVSRRIPGKRVSISCDGILMETSTDSHGHFSVCMDVNQPQESTSIRHYVVELMQPPGGGKVSCAGTALVAGRAARRIIVSDIDDTIIYTGVANKAKMLWRLFALSAQERSPFPGMAALYRALHRGADGNDENPLIYLSRSPWSIYPVLDEFFTMHDFPPEPVLQLREWGITWRHPYPQRARWHKARLLTRLFETFPDHRFLLIGDSGQRDPELYQDFARRHPGRVEAIYIREVGASPERKQQLDAIRDSLAEEDVPMVVAHGTDRLAEDALERGFIQRVGLELTQQEGREERL